MQQVPFTVKLRIQYSYFCCIAFNLFSLEHFGTFSLSLVFWGYMMLCGLCLVHLTGIMVGVLSLDTHDLQSGEVFLNCFFE